MSENVFSEELYGLCQRYCQLFVVWKWCVEEGKDVSTNLADTGNGCLRDLRFCLFDLFGTGKSLGSVDSVDRFNYHFLLNDVFAVVEDEESDFSVRVHGDDVDRLDVMLNGLVVDVINLKNANYNLNNEIVRFNKLLKRKMGEVDDEYILDVLSSLRDEVFRSG